MAVTGNPNLRQRTLMTAGIAIAVIVVITAYQVWHTYGAAVENARRDIAQLAQTFGASTDATFQALELIVDQAAAEVRNQRLISPGTGTLTDRFMALARDWSFVHAVLFIGPDGIVRDGVVRGKDGQLRPGNAALDLSSREFFQYHRDADASGQNVFLTDPVTTTVPERDVIIMITKKVRGVDNSFIGVCSVAISVDTLAQMFAGLLLPARYDGAALFKRNGVLLASIPDSDTVGRSYKSWELFTHQVAAAASGVFRVTGNNGAERISAFNASARYPVVVQVSGTWNSALASWHSASMILGASAASGILLIVALTWWHIGRIRNETAAQLALFASERSLSESQRLAGIGHFEREVGSDVYVWSENMYAMHGVEPGRYVPTRAAFLHLVVAEDQARLTEYWDSLQGRPSSGTMEVRLGLADGRLRNIRYGWRLLESQWGVPAREFGIAQDVTPMRAAEATIRDDEQRLRDIVECSGDYIWESDAAGAVTMFTGGSSGPLDFLGEPGQVAEVEIVGQRCDIATLREAIQGRAKFRNLVVPATDAAGKLRWVRVSANPRFDQDGQFLGYRGAGTDVTEVRHQQERDEDRRKGEALGRLAGGLAHEINNLLQPILIYAAFGASQQSLAGEIRQYFSRIARAAEQATLIVRNVLASARKSPPIRESVNVRDVIRETADLLGGILPPGIALDLDCEHDDLIARVERTGLAQVLTNLVTNAAEALTEALKGGKAAGGRITVSARVADVGAEAARSLGLAPGAYCCMAVADNGVGVPREHLDKVFEPFFTTKPQGKGTGLGLSVVLGLARSWRGTVTVASGAGEPTCFVVYLPIAERQLQAAQ